MKLLYWHFFIHLSTLQPIFTQKWKHTYTLTNAHTYTHYRHTNLCTYTLSISPPRTRTRTRTHTHTHARARVLLYTAMTVMPTIGKICKVDFHKTGANIPRENSHRFYILHSTKIIMRKSNCWKGSCGSRIFPAFLHFSSTMGLQQCSLKKLRNFSSQYPFRSRHSIADHLLAHQSRYRAAASTCK